MDTSRRNSAFLILAPEKSEPYLQQPKETSRTSSTSSTATDASVLDTSAVDTTTEAEPNEATQKTRRSSSISSTSSARRRFLKLGPVHFGGDPLESDFVEAEEE